MSQKISPPKKPIPGLRKHGKQLGYEAELLEPIARNDPRRFRGLLAGPNDKEWHKQEFMRKLQILKGQYDVDKALEHWPLELLFKVLIDWIPGFDFQDDVKKKAGRTKTRTSSVLLELVAEIDKHMTQNVGWKKRSFSAFLKKNRDNPEWEGVGKGRLANLYTEGKKIENRNAQLKPIFDALMMNRPNIWNNTIAAVDVSASGGLLQPRSHDK